MFTRHFRGQAGESSLILALTVALAAGVGLKVAFDKLGDESQVVTDNKKMVWVDNAINSAVLRAEALLKPSRITPSVIPGHILVERVGGGTISPSSQFDLTRSPTVAAGGGWELQNSRTLVLTMVGMGGENLNSDQVVTLRFKKPIIKNSPLDPSLFVLRGFEVEAVTTIAAASGTNQTITRPKTVSVDLCATGGCGSFSDTQCELVGPTSVREPSSGATATLRVRGPALIGNVPRTSLELSNQITYQGANLSYNNRSYSVASNTNLFTTRHVGASGPELANTEKNDITLVDPDRVTSDNWKEWDFSFMTPRPLTAVDGLATVTFPMWATVKLSDGSWKVCQQTSVKVRQVTSCDFDAPNGSEIDNGASNMVLTAQQYTDHASTLALKGFRVPGCQTGCSDYTSQSQCEQGARRNSCFWHDPPGSDPAHCLYRDFRQVIACDSSSSPGASASLVDPDAVAVQRPSNSLPSSVVINWKKAQGGHSCKDMKVFLTMAENKDSQGNPVYYYRTNSGSRKPIPVRPVEDQWGTPLPEQILDRNGKHIGDMPKIIGDISCGSNSRGSFSVSVSHSNFVPRARFTLWGRYLSAQGEGTCQKDVWAGADPCRFTNGAAATGSVNTFGGTQANPQPVTLTFKPTDMIESEGVAYNPFDSKDCRSLGERCFYYPTGSGPLQTRTVFVRVRNPERRDPSSGAGNCSLLGVSRLDLGCFAEGSKIMMGDGSWQRGELVKPGDYVWNPVIKMPVKVIEISNGPEKPALLRFETAVGHKIRVTRNHPIPTKNGLKAAKDVLVGEHLRLMGGDFVEIKSVSYDSPEGSFVWNVRLDGSGKEEEMHYVLVDGVVAGDLTLQEKIETALKFTKIKGQ